MQAGADSDENQQFLQTLAVAEHLNFRHAANALGVAQSSVSARVKALEEDLGILLFERHARGVRLPSAAARGDGLLRLHNTPAQGDGPLSPSPDIHAQADRQRAAFEAKIALGAARRRIICGAKTRKGTPCRNKSEPGKRRCKFHGGKSTGARTPEGIERIREAQRRRWAKTRQEP